MLNWRSSSPSRRLLQELLAFPAGERLPSSDSAISSLLNQRHAGKGNAGFVGRVETGDPLGSKLFEQLRDSTARFNGTSFIARDLWVRRSLAFRAVGKLARGRYVTSRGRSYLGLSDQFCPQYWRTLAVRSSREDSSASARGSGSAARSWLLSRFSSRRFRISPSVALPP